ncbi:MAG TPA: universal stress protein [Acidimicrobiales bacterium]|nr:universal stress protein [Acidimicrobiales bacterium]
MTIHEVLVPLDGSDRAGRALPVARAVADQLGARLGAVVVTDTDPGPDGRDAQLRARRAGCDLDRLVVRADEDVAGGLLAAAPSPSTLLCLATRAGEAGAEPVLRSVGEDVMCRSGAPVLAVGPAVAAGPAAPIQRIVGCAGGAEDRVTDRLLDTMAEWAAALGCEAHLVRVVARGTLAARALAARERLDDVTRRLWARGELATSALVADDDAAAGIIRALGRRRETLAVMAAHSRTGHGARTLGAVTLRVLRGSPVPVLVVPTPVAAAPVAQSPSRFLAAAG